ncbi:MAG TPA: alpha-hydroxy acid oxidase [Beijerinckiaceae bacterium]|nr:alpha-hydroxy acid oxidase [Beijerinckiaceae bacterium]
MTAVERALSIEDLRALARRRAPRIAFDYVDGGAESECGLARNSRAFDALTLVPNYLVDVTQRSAATRVFGVDYAAPFGIGPTGLGNLIWPGTDEAIARAATEAGIPFCLSTPATTSIEQIASIVPGGAWFQLYVPRDRGMMEDLIRRAATAGVRNLLVTIDVPLPSKRERDFRNGFRLPLRPNARMVFDILSHPAWALATLQAGAPHFANYARYVAAGSGGGSLAAFMASQISPAITWDDLAHIRSLWSGNLVVKGVMSVGDAQQSIAIGADGIVVSNHGGRQLDCAPATIAILPDIAEAVEKRVPILFDSGIRRGSDIAKALALGADFVLVGRATLYGAGAAGGAGVKRAIAILIDEFDRVLGQLGCVRIADLTPERVRRAAIP